MHARSFLFGILLCHFGAATLFAAPPVFPGKTWQTAKPADVGLDEAQLRKARDYALSGGGSGMIVRHGKLVLAWGDLKRRYDLKSTTKSIGMIAVGLAIKDGKLKLDDPAVKHHPGFGTPPENNAKTGWLKQITLRHLATQTAGFEKPGGYRKLLFQPGTKWAYSDGGPNWLAECVTLVYKRDIEELMFERVGKPLQFTRADLRWRKNAYRPAEINGVARREFGAGVHANVNAMARLGYLHLRNGRWKETQILPKEFVQLVARTEKAVVGLPEVDPKNHGNASDHYGLLWWNNADGTLKNVPKDAYWSWGLYDSLIVVIPSLDIVVARAGKSWKRSGGGHYDVLRPLLEPIVKASRAKGQGSRARTPHSRYVLWPSTLDPQPSTRPYPPSKLITGVKWAPASEIVRLAKGSDIWPSTWGDDGQLYTAYGDGWGFRPFVSRKLSLGLCVVTGGPPKVAGVNLRSKTAEQIGDGAKGKKASGLLMVDGVLYMWVRNAGNSQLGWSKDRGKTWDWAAWKFTTSFGAPTFLNFGKNYAGARDGYVYVVSHDADSAYQPADRMVLARVPKDRLRERAAYEFFQRPGRSKRPGRLDDRPTWTREMAKRGAVFAHAGNCYRSGLTYNVGLKRYLWCQTLPKGDARFTGGFGIYEAPEPWGPWGTVFFTRKWDVGPGETSSIPTKWISGDGKTAWLLFSGDDSFSLRRGTLTVADPR
jgi:CubicO group peptidase (beta-lactamase class C family)